MKYHFYCIPGLGFNELIFSKLDLSPYPMSILNWIEPDSNESIDSYAMRMSKLIDQQKGIEVILLGHSFGGVMAQEIAKIIPIYQVFIVSSIKSREELTYTLKLVHLTKAYTLFNKNLVLRTFWLFADRHGFTTQAKKDMFVDMLLQNTNNYLQWALKTISAWNGKATLPMVFHIHGDKDIIFPIKNIRTPYYLIEGGNHIMIYDKAAEVSQIIVDRLDVLSRENDSPCLG
jgi:pimeloyl-ACP methyl ester carboxylesterase